MKDIKDIITELKDNEKFSRYSEGLKLYEQWKDIAGSYLSGLSEPSIIKNEVLFVAVQNSVVLHELVYKKCQILKNISERKDMPYIKDIKFRIKSEH